MKAQGSWFRVSGVPSSPGSGFRVSGSGYRFSSPGFRVYPLASNMMIEVAHNLNQTMPKVEAFVPPPSTYGLWDVGCALFNLISKHL